MSTLERNAVAQWRTLGGGAASPRVELVRASDITPEPIHWLWAGWLARGKVHVIAGAPGTGKTWIGLSFTATVTRGGLWPDGANAPCGNALIWSGEDDWADTLVPRLAVAGADLRRVHLVGRLREDDVMRPFDPATDMDQLAEDAARIGDVALLPVDPMVSAVAGDSHKNSEVRRGLQPLVDLATELRCAVVGVSHFSKTSAGRDPVERVNGSIGFTALARLVMVTVKQDADGDEAERRLLLRAKSNNGPDTGGFAYGLEQEPLPEYPGVVASRLVWGGPVTGSARELLAEAQSADSERSATDEAVDWLRCVLEAGPLPAGNVLKQARAAGVSDKAVRRARERLGIKPQKTGFSGGWTWDLPKVPNTSKMPKMPEEARRESWASSAPSTPGAIFDGDVRPGAASTRDMELGANDTVNGDQDPPCGSLSVDLRHRFD